MRPLVYACALVASASYSHCSLHAQDWLRQAIPLKLRTHDFGTVARAAKTEHRFLIKNNSQTDIHLRSIRTSCGCTTPIIETEWIKPGETGSVLARFNTGTFTGSKSATLTISIDKPHFTELQLNVKGYIRSDVVLNPGEVNFGEIPVGEPKALDITLDYAGRSDWQLVGAESSLPFVEVGFEEISRNSGRVSYKISTSLSADAPLGSLQNHVVLKTNDRNLTTVPVRILASVQPAIQISPQELALGSVAPDEPVNQRLVIKARSQFRILEITSEEAQIRFDARETSKPAHVLNLAIIPKAHAKDGNVSSEILIKTDLKDEPIRVPLTFSLLAKSTVSSVVKAD